MVNILKVNLKLAAAEEALALSIWTTATICRVLSLESVISFPESSKTQVISNLCSNTVLFSLIFPLFWISVWHIVQGQWLLEDQ